MRIDPDDLIQRSRPAGEWLQWLPILACLGAGVLTAYFGLYIVAAIAALFALSLIPRVTMRYVLTRGYLNFRVLWIWQVIPLANVTAIEPLSPANSIPQGRVWTDYSVPLTRVWVVTAVSGEDKYRFRFSPRPEFVETLNRAWARRGTGPAG